MSKILKRGCVRLGLKACFGLFKVLPFKAGLSFTRGLTAFVALFLGRQKRVARQNLDRAFGSDLTARQREDILWSCINNFGQSITEIIYFYNNRNMRDSLAVMEGQEHLDAAILKGRGVVLLSGHFGNFPLAMLYLAHKGYQVNVIIRPQRDEKIGEYLNRKMTKLGLNVIYAIPRRACVLRAIQALRNNEALFILPDQNFGGDGHVFTDFFGHPAATGPGAYVLAKRTGAAVLPLFVVRSETGKNVVRIQPEVGLEEAENEELAVQQNMQKMTRVIEDQIRQYPGQWSWMHKRWKTRPNDRQQIKDNR